MPRRKRAARPRIPARPESPALHAPTPPATQRRPRALNLLDETLHTPLPLDEVGVPLHEVDGVTVRRPAPVSHEQISHFSASIQRLAQYYFETAQSTASGSPDSGASGPVGLTGWGRSSTSTGDCKPQTVLLYENLAYARMQQREQKDFRDVMDVMERDEEGFGEGGREGGQGAGQEHEDEHDGERPGARGGEFRDATAGMASKEKHDGERGEERWEEGHDGAGMKLEQEDGEATQTHDVARGHSGHCKACRALWEELDRVVIKAWDLDFEMGDLLYRLQGGSSENSLFEEDGGSDVGAEAALGVSREG